MVATYQDHRPAYERITRQQAWFLGLADLLDVPLTKTHDWPTQTGAEVAQALSDYLDVLDALGTEWADELRDDLSLFRHLRRRVEQWAPGLFWTFEIPALPRTNNDLEADIGDIKDRSPHHRPPFTQGLSYALWTLSHL